MANLSQQKFWPSNENFKILLHVFECCLSKKIVNLKTFFLSLIMVYSVIIPLVWIKTNLDKLRDGHTCNVVEIASI